MTVRKPRIKTRDLVPQELLTGKVVPSERWEAVRFVDWLERMKASGLVTLFSHIANENPGRSARLQAWRLGTRGGVPDYVIVLPSGQCVWVELKRTSISRTSKEQLAWVKALAPYAKVCNGSEAAVSFVLKHLQRKENG